MLSKFSWPYLGFIILICFGIQSQAQQIQKPKLIVSIIVDPLSPQWIEKYKDHFTENGLAKLYREGMSFQNAQADQFLIDRASAVTIISTGAPASLNGIIGSSWYDRLKKDEIFCTEDYKSTDLVNFTPGPRHSSQHLLVTTTGDQLKLNSNGKVISLSLEADAAVLSGGHKTDGTYWFDSQTGTFTSNTSFISSLPDWVNSFNNSGKSEDLLNSDWDLVTGPNPFILAHPDDSPHEIGIHGTRTTFPYKLSRMKRTNSLGQYEVLKNTPFGNTLLTDFAIESLKNEELGSDAYTDYLCITFTGFDQIIRMYGPESQEAADAIVRLDTDIERLISKLIDQVGKDDLMVVFTGTHGSSWNVNWALAEGLPAGQFRARNAIALLNSYLSAIYGENYWIESYVNQQFYLDHSLIDQNQIPISEIQEKAARFLTQFTGIADAFTATQFNLINMYNTNGSVFLNTYHTKRSGDILINLEPGWIQDGNFVSDHLSIYEYDQKVPLVFWGGATQAQVSNVPVTLSNIAPTICRAVNIPVPSGSNSKSLTNYLVYKDAELR